MYDENCQNRYENSTVITKYPLAQSTPIKTSTKTLPSFEKDQISQNNLSIFSNTSLTERRKSVIIKLPSYIINSHPISKKSEQDISHKYNIQLVSPENERLYIANHYALLQVMTQYVYYRKLCVWIKEELAKKRIELLEIARNALINARDSNICLLEHMSDSELTVDEKKSLMKYAQEAAMDEFHYSNNQNGRFNENSNENKHPNLDHMMKPLNPNNSTRNTENDSTCYLKCPNQPENLRKSNSVQPSEHCQLKNLPENLKALNQNHEYNGCDICPSNLEKDFRIKRQNEHCSGFDEVYVCDKCGSNSRLKSGKKFKMEVDRGTNPEPICIKADSCTCQARQEKTSKKCCVIL